MKFRMSGLQYRARKNGPAAPYWVASKAAVKAGWPIKMVNLSETPAGQLERRCARLQAEMAAFMAQDRPEHIRYDGTVRSILNLYQSHPNSPYHKLKGSSLKPYDVYLAKLSRVHGERRVSALTGLDVLNWHAMWAGSNEPKLAGAAMALHVLKTALSFGQICGFTDCEKLRQTLSLLSFPHPKPRNEAPTAGEVQAAMDAARKLGRPLAALAYALQFETAARQWDIIGQWFPLSDPRPSPVHGGGKKWIGPTWAAIDADMVLTLTPSKTIRTTGARVHVDLKLCPMVMSEIASLPERAGPLILNEATGQPYTSQQFMLLWRRVRAEAGLSLTLWNRDLRAGAITEGGIAGATADDRAKLAGHAGPKMTRKVYDRDVLVASNRVAEARAKFRKDGK